MKRAFRHLLLLWLFVIAQTGALAHGISHFSPHDHAAPGGEPVCELCLAYAPLGAGAPPSAQLWQAPTAVFSFAATLVVVSTSGFRPAYQSRAPPACQLRLCRVFPA